jgi:2-dehydro-3-deoxyphosphogluconate aldolase / (4S)-4-hydroxy-2-oxoglutarate aldolase
MDDGTRHPAPGVLDRAAVIPVIVARRVADAVPLARALVAGGLPVLEVTLRTPAALEAITRIAAEVPEAVVGGGAGRPPAGGGGGGGGPPGGVGGPRWRWSSG